MKTLTQVRYRFATCAALLALSMAASAQSLVTYTSSGTSDWVGQGQSFTGNVPPYAVTANLRGTPDGSSVEMQFMDNASMDFALLILRAPDGQVLTAGTTYEQASRGFFGVSPGLDFGAHGRGCNQVLGRFTVLDIAIGPGPSLARLAVDFEQHCELTEPALFGSVRFNSPVPVSPAAGASTPYPFSLQAQGPVSGGTVVVSNTITVMGVSVPVPISITGGDYSVNGGPYTTGSGNVVNHDHVSVRLVASQTAGQVTTATLTIGGVSSGLAVKTFQPGQPLTSLHFKSPFGDPVGLGQERLYMSPPHRFTATRNASNGVDIRIDTFDDTLWSLNFALPGGALPVPGRYTGATRYPFQAAGVPGFDLSGDGRGCNQESGEFTILEAAFAPNGDVLRFAADLVQSCENTMPPIRAEIRFNSNAYFPALSANTCTTFAQMQIDSDGDGSPDCIENAEGINPFVKDNDVFNNGRLFVEQLYRDFLGREGDEIGIAYWANEVNTGGHTRPEVIRIFVHTPEFEQRVAPVARLYFAYFLRWPDVAGLRYWIAAYHSGMSLDAIGAVFAESPEFTSRYAGLDNAGYVDQVYRNVLGRAPDPSGLAGWTSELDTGLLTRPQLMQRFVGSNEFVALSAHEVIVSMAYYGMLRREPDPSGFAFWVSYLDGGQPDLALLDGYFRSAEYRARFF